VGFCSGTTRLGFNRDRQNASRLFGSVYGSEGTVEVGDIINAYKRADNAEKNVVQALYEDFKAAQKLGVTPSKAIEIMKSNKVGQEMIKQVMTGSYRRFTPGDALLKEMRKTHPERHQEFLQIYGSTALLESLDGA
jgi:hypothetical protein